MSGCHIGRDWPYGLLDTDRGTNLEMYNSLTGRAEAAIRAVYRELDDAAQITWLRGLADDIEAEGVRTERIARPKA